MKTIKKYAMALVALVVATGIYGAYAFNSSEAEVKTKREAIVYHFVSANGEQINFEEGEPSTPPCLGGDTPCRWESDTPLTSPMTAEQIEAAANVTNRLNP